MRWTQLLIPTLKEAPADAQAVSHQLMLRAGLIRQLGAGTFSFLPLGLRSLHKASQIVREEMNAIGAAEVLLPALQPLELWQKSGRDIGYGENLMKLKDRHGRSMVLGPTHEEVITELVGACVNSYKQLPLSLYQIQTKFRDEYRPRFGLLRLREFLMKDAYSFHATEESLNQTYDAMYNAYARIFTRCGIPFLVAEAQSGPIGGSASHEFVCPCATGEDVVVTSDKGNYAANLEKARTGPRPWTFSGEPTGPLEKVHTPGLASVEEVGKFMGVKPKNILKTLVFQASSSHGVNWVAAVVRGDHEVNEAKLLEAARETMGVAALQLADTPELRAKFAVGFVGPDAAMKVADAALIVDPDAAQAGFWAAGANEIDYHVKHFNWFRDAGDRLADPAKVAVADIRNAQSGDPSPRSDGGVLATARGIELGHIFKLGTRYSEALGAYFLDAAGQQHPIIMGCYGIGIARILMAAVEAFHDERGILWPAAIAPFSVVLTPIRYEGEVKEATDRLYEQLKSHGIDTILDDRDARPGFKFADADLIGFPLRINIGERNLKDGIVELKRRSSTDVERVRLDEVVQRIRSELSGV